jgi:hypothetical protein
MPMIAPPPLPDGTGATKRQEREPVKSAEMSPVKAGVAVSPAMSRARMIVV